MKTLSTMLFAALLAAAVLNAQPTATPNQAPQPIQNIVLPTVQFCPPNTTVLMFSDWNSRTVRELCDDGSIPARQRVVLSNASQVTQVIPVSSNSFYAYGGTGKLTFYVDYGQFGGVNISQWRIPGGGFVVGTDNYSVLFNSPWDDEAQQRISLYGSGYYYSDSNHPSAAPSSCGPAVRFKTLGDELCINPRQWAVLFAKSSLFGGPDYDHAQFLFGGEQPVNLAGFGDTVYLTLGNRYEGPENSVPGQLSTVSFGKLVAIRTTFEGKIDTQLVLGNLDIETDLSQQRLAVNGDTVYLIEGVTVKGRRGRQIVALDVKSKGKRVILSDNDGAFGEPPFLSGLAIKPM